MVEKIVAKELFQYYKEYFKLYPRKMGRQKERSAIDAVVTLIYIV